MLTLEQLLDGYTTYKHAFEEAVGQLQQADKEIEELSKRSNELLGRLVEKDIETIKLARQIRELVKELAQYRGRNQNENQNMFL